MTSERPGLPPGYPRRRAGLAKLSPLAWVVLALVLGFIVAGIVRWFWQ